MTRDTHLLCEGYHDRDFLSGWFEHEAGWKDPTNGGTRPLTLFAGERPLRGAFIFERGDRRISVAPMGGIEALRQRLAAWLEEITRLGVVGYEGTVVVADGDHLPSDASDPVSDLVKQALVTASSAPTGDQPWSHGGVAIDFVSMAAGAAQDVSALPARENLERIVATAFARAYPDRHAAMTTWLQARPSAPAESSKAWMWSVMAGWFPDNGCTDFLRRAIWQDQRMRDELVRVLQNTRLPRIEERLRGG